MEDEIMIKAGDKKMQGDLFMPPGAKAIIIFSHGSGSSRFSRRNRQVADYLHGQGFGTLLFDLLTAEEDSVYTNRFDIALLTERLILATNWVAQSPLAANCPIGYFGASTGAASAIQAAAKLPQIFAVVSRGGRPDLASKKALNEISAAVLLVVGSLDRDVLRLNKEALSEIKSKKELIVVDGASHLFEEEGKLGEVARIASEWFHKNLHSPDPSRK